MCSPECCCIRSNLLCQSIPAGNFCSRLQFSFSHNGSALRPFFLNICNFCISQNSQIHRAVRLPPDKMRSDPEAPESPSLLFGIPQPLQKTLLYKRPHNIIFCVCHNIFPLLKSFSVYVSAPYTVFPFQYITGTCLREQSPVYRKSAVRQSIEIKLFLQMPSEALFCWVLSIFS